MPIVSRHISLISLGCLLAALWAPQSAQAQTAAGQTQQPRRWTFEVYGGGASPAVSTSGVPLATFPVGRDFTTDAGRPSRLQASWFFGDGAKMLNNALSEFSRLGGTSFTQVAPLDAAVTTNALAQSGGAVFGVRLGRRLSSRLAVELGVERSQTPSDFTGNFRDALQQSTDSFEAAFTDLLASAPVNSVDVATSLDISGTTGAQTRVTGAVTYTLVQSGKVTAYATAGGGLAMVKSNGPEAVLNGSYSFRYFGAFPMRERDRVLIRVNQPSSSAMAVFGGGITYDVGARSGVRVDVRLSLQANKASIVMSGSPDITSQTTSAVLSSATTPGLQFSTRPGTSSSLSADRVALTTFTGTGRNKHLSFTIGLFRRF